MEYLAHSGDAGICIVVCLTDRDVDFAGIVRIQQLKVVAVAVRKVFGSYIAPFDGLDRALARCILGSNEVVDNSVVSECRFRLHD